MVKVPAKAVIGTCARLASERMRNAEWLQCSATLLIFSSVTHVREKDQYLSTGAGETVQQPIWQASTTVVLCVRDCLSVLLDDTVADTDSQSTSNVSVHMAAVLYCLSRLTPPPQQAVLTSLGTRRRESGAGQ